MKLFVKAAPGYESTIDSVPHGHPIDGPLRKDGAYWTADHFTFRMRDDGVIIVDDSVQPLASPSTGPESLRATSRTGEGY